MLADLRPPPLEFRVPSWMLASSTYLVAERWVPREPRGRLACGQLNVCHLWQLRRVDGLTMLRCDSLSAT